ncbi:glycosyltransferase family 2 protein [Lacrimispora celerecrescens]|uniref:glycosyltransferase family 2 protein n=1 Tax=Lacrimispora celerecrescens TaxID=29354 RepID=UPI00164773FA|nr:glycosyltransferase family 2 protein [Lacrimispora celerecrescens]
MSLQILLSSYNGEKYIRFQLNSLLAQTYQDFKVLIRDDGSLDKTREILEEYAQRDSRITWYGLKNLGVVESFFDLIKHADLSCDYFAFADQDDEWLPEKLEKAIKVLQAKGFAEPMLYCSDKIIVDEKLRPLAVQVTRDIRKLSFGNALVQGICTGCTAVWNRKLMEVIAGHMPKRIEYVVMHDWWLYMAASCLGAVYYDDHAYIRYRQHQNNKVGAMITKRQLFFYRMKQLKKPRGEIYRQVKEFVMAFEREIPAKNKDLAIELLKAEKSFLSRIKIFSNKEIFRQKADDDLIFRIIVLIGKL